MIDNLKNKSIFYKNYEIINFINTNELEKSLILEWRNNENVRKWMVNNNIISLEEHLNYINSLKNKDDKLCFLIKEYDEYLGIIEFDEINLNTKSAYFGINANIDIKVRGIGRILESISTYIAKELLKLETLKLYVFKENSKAINLYKKSNYFIKEESTINRQKIIYMEKTL
jgi:UDP-4-amino-4,6-dideoxy-N-acetyl-beta-L-altrosamine N-acetyltransferase